MDKLKHWFKGLSVKIIAGCVIVALSVCVAVAWIGYSTYKSNVLSLYERITKTVLMQAYHLIDSDELAACVETRQKSEAYEQMQTMLDQLKDDSGVEYIYALRVNAEQNGVEYLFTAFNSEERKDPEYAFINILDPDTENYTDLLPAFLELQQKKDQITIIRNYTEDFGESMTAHIPLYTSQGALVGILAVDISIQEISEVINHYLLTVTLGTLALLVVFIAIYVGINRHMILQPIHSLAESAKSFVKRRDDEEVLVNSFPEIRSGDEIQTMADAFREMAGSIQQYMENLQKVTRDRERIATELHVATEIQASLLPRDFLRDNPDPRFSVFATMQPAKEVGGDFYDYFMIDEDHLGITMADVSGKGVPAALFMAIGKTIIKHCAQLGVSPGQVLSLSNEQLCQSNDGGLFITAFFGVLELSSGILRFANAGHNPPLIRTGETEYDWLKMRRALPLAAMEGMHYRDDQIQLQPGATIFLYTDGVTEATDPANTLYGDPRLLATMRALQDEDNLQALLTGVKADIDLFANGAAQADDITMLAVHYAAARTV